ncbi:MAG: tRNA uridine(34) 5-carboxymethylaminomethyl modification radical SAM/GNAT enzyme Elp3 [Candidatus Yonathbacteria bacterium]|nr:tRNA uridine(34) 5-carboxymethylaminomethyl modification radical SAM/GNAT enzyme Elp3 [Candidatus Yonathbacteria bacterium]
MLFQDIKNDKDLQRLKRDILADKTLYKRFLEVCEGNFVLDSRLISASRFGQGSTAGELKMPTNAEILAFYRALVARGEEPLNLDTEAVLKKIKTRSNSGVAVVSLLTKEFPCPGRCVYCPTEARMPKSYLSKEPAAARALANDFDPYEQVTNRLRALVMNGHETDKVEIIIIGGTWSFYHPVYQEEFIAEVFRACNNFSLPPPTSGTLEVGGVQTTKGAKSLAELQTENETVGTRIIGLSVETRPDYITTVELERLRILGVTKVELGVQHLDDDILKFTKRDMKISTVALVTERLRNAGFKVVYHMMPNLPGSNPARDIEMFGELFSGENFQPDMLKIYPCMVLEGSELFDLWEQGEFTPYSDEELMRVLVEVKKQVPKYVRIIRVVRDIPAPYIQAGSKVSNLRQWLLSDMKKNNWRCVCIRCREVRGMVLDFEKFPLTRFDYRTTTGREIFLSFEERSDLENSGLRSDINSPKLASFLRLRLPDNKGEEFKRGALEVLCGSALVRELHTYGRMVPIGGKGTQSQHLGFGTRLLLEAERIAREAGYEKLVIISGIGAREYYKNRGYQLESTYMVKYL